MKLIYLSLLFLFIFRISFSQNYLSIKPDAISYYYGTGDETVFPIRIDSIISHGDSTDYYSFCMIRPIENSVYYTIKGPSWIGKKMTDCGNGMNLFYNYENDTIFIKTNAGLYETWRMYTYPNGDYITASISDIIIDSYSELIDSVKIIHLSLSNSLGTSLPGVINTYQLKLSKNYGFFIITDFYSFPFDPGPASNFYISSPEMALIGLSNPQTGWQNLTIADVYSMQAGDEIHYDFAHYNGAYPGAYSQTRQTINKFLNRIENITQDTIIFTVEICQRTTTHHYYPYDTVVYFYHDTVQSIKIITDYNFNKLPLEPFFDGYQWGYFNKIDTFGYQPEHAFIPYLNYLDSLTPSLYNGWTTTYYFKGLGNETFHFNNYYNGDEDIQVYYYYNVNSIEWGTPLYCDSLSLNTKENAIFNEISIFPNPACNFITLGNCPLNSNIRICTLQGKTVIYKISSAFYETIDLLTIPEGMYIVKIDNNNTSFIKKLIISR